MLDGSWGFACAGEKVDCVSQAVTLCRSAGLCLWEGWQTSDVRALSSWTAVGGRQHTGPLRSVTVVRVCWMPN